MESLGNEYIASCSSRLKCEGSILCLWFVGKNKQQTINSRVCFLGLPAKERSEIQQQWMEGICPVIVATVSFGMGVDKANVR